MFRKISGLVLALALVLSGVGVLLGPPTLAHAGGGQTPTVKWSNPSSMMYGGWPVSTSTYLYNPLGTEVKFTASIWFNGAVLDTGYYGVSTVWHSRPQVHSDNSRCDGTGCVLTFSGSVPAYGRSYIIFGVTTGRSLGSNMTVGSATVEFDGFPGSFVVEGKTSLTEGPGLSVSMGADPNWSPLGGYTPLIVKATDSHLNSFQLLGIGTDCASAVVPNIGYTMFDTTNAQWYFSVYVPDNVGSCTITALIRTNQTVLVTSYVIDKRF